MRDYYAVLGVATGSTPGQIRRAFQRLARRYSPDVNLWDQEAQAGAPGPESTGAPGAGDGKGDVIDAEFKDLGEKK